MKRAIVFGLVAALAGVAHADKNKKAEQEFDRGKKLLAQKEYAEACAAFENSDEMDPGIGVKLNAGKCFEEWGKLARAYRWYNDARQLAVDTNDERVSDIDALLKKLDADVPKLTIKAGANADLAAAEVAVDGKQVAVELLGSPMRVDPGPHEVTWKGLTGPKSKTVAFERGGKQEIQIEVKALPPPPPPDPTLAPKKPPPPPPDPGHGRKLLGMAVGGVGVVGLGVASALTISARGKYHDAIDTHCMGQANQCDAEGLSITHDARHRANIATGITLVSVLAVAGGVVLYLTAPKADEQRSVYLAPAVTSEGAAVVLGGTY